MNSDDVAGIDDNEVNQMIAGIGGATPTAPQPIVGHASGMANATPPTVAPQPAVATPSAPVVAAPVAQPQPTAPAPVVVDPPTEPADDDQPTTNNTDLDGIKHAAVEELRPLVEKLDLPPEERFDTMLLIIRSTDDASLVPKAYDAARAIPDETRRAQALLDIIKEIDYFGHG